MGGVFELRNGLIDPGHSLFASMAARLFADKQDVTVYVAGSHELMSESNPEMIFRQVFGQGGAPGLARSRCVYVKPTGWGRIGWFYFDTSRGSFKACRIEESSPPDEG